VRPLVGNHGTPSGPSFFVASKTTEDRYREAEVGGEEQPG
jgi:hypothetical protein